jgi:hypothetical protein
MTPTLRQSIALVQNALSPDLLKGRWTVVPPDAHATEGHCYVAAEALWHLLGREHWQPMCASYQDEHGPATHWWLVHKVTGRRGDPTREQYGEQEPPYHLGRKAGFLTKQPSRRAQIVLDRIASVCH